VASPVKGASVRKPQWGDFGSLWKTIREVDVNAISQEAERGATIVCVGQIGALWWVEEALRSGPDRYPPQGQGLALVLLGEARSAVDVARTADLVIVALDASAPLSAAEAEGLRLLLSAPAGRRLTLLFGEYGAAAAPGSATVDPYTATRVDPESPDAAVQVRDAVFDALPRDVRLAAARLLPGLRPAFAARLTSEVSTSNAAVALASGMPSLVPMLGIPISAADTVILTKNQALMVYRLALACGAPPDFQRRMFEITPVVGGAVVWRQIAGALVGMVPGYGIVPKTAVAFGGTYVVGLLASRWYETGVLTDAERKRLTADAADKAREVATVMVARTRAVGGRVGAGTYGRIEKVTGGATAARERAASAASQARGAARRLRAGGRQALRRSRVAAGGAVDEQGLPLRPPLPPPRPPDETS